MMDFLFGIVGGTALLMYGVDLMGEGLENMSSSMMKKILEKFTGKLWKAFLAGIFLTAAVQSSTAISVLSVGFVNSGIMRLSQAIGIIYGANIGTTITAQFMALSFSFNIITLSLPILGIGYILYVSAHKVKLKSLGQAFMGIGFLLLGLRILNEGIPYMEQSKLIRDFFEHYASNVVFGILLGTVTTALVHSSAATVGIVILLGNSGLIDLRTAIILMLGDNIGTSITALIASLKGNINAKRTAWGHALHNLIGVLIALPFLNPFVSFIEYFTVNIQGSDSIQVMIANSHTIFNIIVALIFLPLNKYFVQLLMFLVKERTSDEGKVQTILDPLLLDTPVASLGASIRELTLTLQKVTDNNVKALNHITSDRSISDTSPIRKEITRTQKELTLYMMELYKRSLTETQSIMIPGIIKGAKYLERMGSLTDHLEVLAVERLEKECYFTPDAMSEVENLSLSLQGLYEETALHLSKDVPCDLPLATESWIHFDELLAKANNDHIMRLEKDQCSIEASLVYLEILSTLERIKYYLFQIKKLACYEFQGSSSPLEVL
ncbi:Na/Pi cotransporter family protein [Proteiniclasticum ruminis]|uniref:Phosphate:Na+ symporter n=1 Tax=Proteiniclasticum ruminis TaxID=398199 RepID=A0A1I5CR92_9CLOT|nr:Na/Pi cotransporter family protein [Proteiniclasticum ruminis]SFN89414.1 phosphate:Na+ symporter [Proteiniclasticum ruminis]